MIIPVEAWFLNNTEFVVVLDQRALGAASTRARLQPLIGSFRGITYGSSNNRYSGTYNSRNKTFRGTRTKLRSSSWSYPHTATVQGSFSITGTSLRVNGNFTTSVNPSGPDTPQYVGTPSFTANLTKTSRLPSAEISSAFSDSRGR